MKIKENVVGKNIKKLLAIKGLNRKQMAQDLGITYRAVSSWITGEKKPRLNKLEEIANYLGVNTASLLQSEISKEDILKTIEDEDPVERLARLLYDEYMSVPDKYKPQIERELLQYASHLKREVEEKKE